MGLEFADEASRRLDHELARQLDRLSTVSANRLDDLQEISAIAGACATAVAVIALVQESYGVWTRIHAQFFCHGHENALVDFARRCIDAHLVANPAQEGVVDQVLGIEVGGENGQL